MLSSTGIVTGGDIDACIIAQDIVIIVEFADLDITTITDAGVFTGCVIRLDVGKMWFWLFARIPFIGNCQIL